jgi:ADP-ribosylglycohydrolase
MPKLDLIKNIKSFSKKMLNKDRMYGAFYAAFLGDALGVPHEEPWGKPGTYTGRLEYNHTLRYRFVTKNLALGQYSDDTHRKRNFR